LQETHITCIKQNLFKKNLLKKQRNHRIWMRGIFDLPITRKPNEIRMGKGKGNVDHWVLNVKPGKILFELSPMSVVRAKHIFKIITSALGVPTHIILVKKISPTVHLY
jgi:ribosomal protein L16